MTTLPLDVDAPLLDLATCLELLDRAGIGSLACTYRAVPSVLPASVRVQERRIEVGVGAAAVTWLEGQVVALGTGFPPSPRCDGWWVLVHGELRKDPRHPGLLVLEPFELEGRVLPATEGRWWPC